MSMSSVTEAPPWRHERSVVRGDRLSWLRAPERIELLGADPRRLSFTAQRAMVAPVFLCPLLLALGGLPWLAPPPLSAARAATSGACLAAAVAIAAWGRPRRRRVEVFARGGGATDGHAVQPGKVRWVLHSEHAPGTPRTTHGVTLEAEGVSLTVLQSSDPERLLWQFSEVLRHWPGPVDCRWGLPDEARPWSVEPHSGPRALNDDAGRSVAVVPLAHRPLIWCARIMTALVLIDLGFLLTSSGAGLVHIHPLSVALAAAFACCMLALTLALASGSSRLLVSRRVCRETALFGIRRQRGALRIESVRGVHALGSAEAERWHVLLDSADGPLAIEVARGDADALAREVEHAIAAARSGSEPRTSQRPIERRS